MLVVTTSSATETQEVAAAVASVARPGDLLLLTGDLGAGKTTFTQGFGRALGVDQPITSPTFTLHRRYEGRLPLDHLDVYRLGGLEEVADLGLAELLESGGVTLIEWGDTILSALPEDYLQIRLRLGESDDERVIELDTAGDRWACRWDHLVGCLAAVGLPTAAPEPDRC